MYPDVQAQTTSGPASQPVFVEVNSHTGAQATQFKHKYPHVPGRLVMHNVQQILDKEAEDSSSNVEKIAYSFLASHQCTAPNFTTRGVFPIDLHPRKLIDADQEGHGV